MKWILWLVVLVMLSGCTSYTRHLYVYVEDGGTLTFGDIEILSEYRKGDEQLTNAPEITPSLQLDGMGL